LVKKEGQRDEMIHGIDMAGREHCDPQYFASAIRELRSVQKPSGNSPLQDAALESARKSKTASASGDMLLLSPSAKQISDFFAVQEATDSENGEVDLEGMKLRGEMLAEALQMQLGAFQNKMVGILGSVGMDAATPFTMQADSLGGSSATRNPGSNATRNGTVRVTNGHPDAAGIEALMQNMPGLSKEFREIASLASVVRANNLNARADDLGSMNPLSVAAQYAKNNGSQFGDRFNLRLGANDLSYFFN